MTINELKKLIEQTIAEGHGDAEVAIDFDAFTENENGSILTVESGSYREVQGADDSGPVGEKFPFLVLNG